EPREGDLGSGPADQRRHAVRVDAVDRRLIERANRLVHLTDHSRGIDDQLAMIDAEVLRRAAGDVGLIEFAFPEPHRVASNAWSGPTRQSRARGRIDTAAEEDPQWLV